MIFPTAMSQKQSNNNLKRTAEQIKGTAVKKTI